MPASRVKLGIWRHQKVPIVLSIVSYCLRPIVMKKVPIVIKKVPIVYEKVPIVYEKVPIVYKKGSYCL